jgi:hypothetical protein
MRKTRRRFGGRFADASDGVTMAAPNAAAPVFRKKSLRVILFFILAFSGYASSKNARGQARAFIFQHRQWLKSLHLRAYHQNNEANRHQPKRIGGNIVDGNKSPQNTKHTENYRNEP